MQASNEWGPWEEGIYSGTVFRQRHDETRIYYMTAEYANELEDIKRQFTEPFPEPQSNWTKDQWKQLAHLARRRAEAAEAKLRRAEGLLPYLQHRQTCSHWKVGLLVPCTCGLGDALAACRSEKGEGA